MGSRADSAGSDAALLPKEVGARLRQFRLEAGLTQPMKAKVEVKAEAEATNPPAQTLTSTLTSILFMKQAVIALFAEMERRGEFG